MLNRNDKKNQIQILKQNTKIKIKALKNSNHQSENDIKYLKTELKSQIKKIKHNQSD